MAERLTTWSEAALQRGTIRPVARVIVYRKYNGQFYPYTLSRVTQYELSKDRSFGSATLSLTIPDNDGFYNPDNQSSRANYILLQRSEALTYNTDAFFAGGTHENAVSATGPSRVTLAPNVFSGVWTTDVIDFGPNFVSTSALSFLYSTPASRIGPPGRRTPLPFRYSYIDVYARSGNTLNVDDGTWSDWMHVATLSLTHKDIMPSYVTQKRYIQLRFRFTTTHLTLRPELFSVTVRIVVEDMLGDYSPLLYYGNKITLEEGVYDQVSGSVQWFKKFTGIIDTVTPDYERDSASITVNARDMMALLTHDIFGSRENNNVVYEPQLIPATLDLVYVPPESSTEELPVAPGEVYRVFKVPDEPRNNPTITNPTGDPKYKPWADAYPVVIRVAKKFISGVPQWEVADSDGYQIDYYNGVVYFRDEQRKVDASGNPLNEVALVQASFSWYDLDTSRFEDVVADIIKRAIASAGYDETWTVTADYSTTSESLQVIHESTNFRIVLDMSQPRINPPRTVFRLADGTTFFDGLNTVRRYVQPNYLIYADADGNFIGKYHVQQVTPDYELYLKRSLSAPISGEGVYTKVIATGVKREPAVPVTGKVVYVNNNPVWEIQTRYPDKPEFAAVNPVGGDPSWFYNNGTKDGDSSYWIDRNINTRAGWWGMGSKSDGIYWTETIPSGDPEVPDTKISYSVLYPIDAFVVELDRPVFVHRVDVLFGMRPDKGESNGGIENEFGVRVFAAVELGSGATMAEKVRNAAWAVLGDLSSSESKWQSIEQVSLDFKVRYVKLSVTKAAVYKANVLDRHHCWSIAELRVYGSEQDTDMWDIYGSATIDDLVDDELISADVAEEIKSRMGTRTLVLPRDVTLHTDDAVRERAKAYLFDVVRNLYTAEVEVVWSPHLELGQTVLVRTPLTGTSRNYFIERMSLRNNGPVNTSVVLGLVAWR